MRRSTNLFLILSLVGFIACSNDPSDEEDTGAGDGDGDGDGDSGDGDGDSGSETGEGEGEETAECPPGTFDCPCDDGECVEGLTCGGDGVCSLGGGDGDTGDPTGDPSTTGDPTTGGGPTNAYDPDQCEAPSEILHVELLEGSFCATPCIGDEECPDGPPGTDPACTISTNGQEPNFCGLICDPTDSACPEGSSCKEIPQQTGTGLCTFP